MIADLVLCNAKAYINEKIIDCSIAVSEGKILKIGREANMPKTEKKMDLRNLLILPGLIDAHVHLRDEGKAYKEDFYSGTAAAVAGGITTVLDMPNNEPVTMSGETLKNRMETAAKKILVNVGFYSEFPRIITEIEHIVKEGAVAFKLFMAEQIGGLNIDDDNALVEAFKIVHKLKLPVAVHAEDKATIKETEDKLKLAEQNDIEAFLEAHSINAEVNAVNRLLKIVQKTSTHLHFCHVSTENALKEIANNKKRGMTITCEVTPHHLFLSTDDLRKIGTLALTMPPIREKKHSFALWDGVKSEAIDIIASDHAPHTLQEKKADVVWHVKVGIPNLETTLPLLLTEVNRRQLSIGDLVRLMAEKPAEIFQLKTKGSIKEGNSADLTVVDLKKEYKINAANFHSKAKYSPFDQQRVKGKIAKTFINGQLVMDNGEIVANAGSGKIIKRKKN